MANVNIKINGKELTADSEKTILQVVKENGIDEIPTLCHDDRLEHFTSCFVCVVEIEGMNKLVPSCATKVSEGMSIITNNEKVRSSRKTALELLLSNHYADCIGPCQDNCPAGVDAQTYIALISMGKYKEAVKLIKENNPMPLSIGRVCVRDCETGCRRNFVDEAVGVNMLKRYVADIDAANKWTPDVKPSNGKKVAIIGGGPAGLTAAYYLSLEGYRPTILEKLPKLGGMLRYGIPEYRLPKNILDSEIQWILDLGVDVRTGVEMGVDFCIEDLKKEGFEAIFLGVGAHKASKLGLDGEDKTEGVFRGIDFLREVELSYIPELIGDVVVVGGGNTAIDAARTALRCGAESVKIVYRRSIKEMPAHHEEIEAAQKEGVEILFLTNPKSLITENGKLKGIECLKMQLVETEAGKRPRPVPVEGSEYVVKCEFLIGAIGQAVDTHFAESDKACHLEKWGTVTINEKTFETSIEGVFAGGDVVTGPLTAISSIAQGKNAAYSIMSWLETGKAKELKEKFVSLKDRLTPINEHEFDTFKKLAREKMDEMEISERIHCFKEVEHGINENQAETETIRCLECGCSDYYDCNLRQYCDEYEVNVEEFVGETRKYDVDSRHPFIKLDPNKCINCGKCIRTCSEVLKVAALGFVNRGFKSIVKPAMEKALQETNCIACGNCIDACPTGAISEKFPFKILGTLPKENIETICNFCSVGCKINYKKVSDDIFYVSNTSEEIKDTHNQGFLCTKGRFGHRYLMEKNRLLNPVIRKNGLNHYVTTDEALLYASKKIISLIDEYGKDSVALFVSPKLSNEELYLAQKFVRTGFKNNNIHSIGNMLYGLETTSLDDMLGFTSSTLRMEDLDNADTIVVVNSNLSEENLVMELKIKAAQKKGTKVILVNSSEIKLTKYADLWVDSRKGTNTALFNAVMKKMIDEEKFDVDFINGRTEGFAGFREMISKYEAAELLGYSEIAPEKFDELYDDLTDENKNVVFIYNIESTSDKSVNDLRAIADYLLLTNRIGKGNNGVLVLRESNNSTGLADMGALPDYLPGRVKTGEKSDIERIEKFWGSGIQAIFNPVDLAREMKKGNIKGAIVIGEDPLIYKENHRFFNHIEFMMVMDSFKTETAGEADVIIPMSTHIEKSGSYTRLDNVIQKSNKVVNSPLDVENWEVICKFAKYFGIDFEYHSTEEIYNEITQVNRYYDNVDSGKSWLNNYYNNGFSHNKIKFLDFELDFSTFDPVRPAIQYPENYYLNVIKQKLS